MATHKALRGGGTIDNTTFLENSAYVAGTSSVGPNGYIGNGAFVGAGTTIGARVLICDLVRIGAGSTIGDDVTIECGNVILPGTVIPSGSTLLDPCCTTPPIPPEGAMLQFDSINVVGTRLATFDTTGFTPGTLAYVGNDTFPNQASVHDFFSLVYGENLTPDTFGTDVVNSPTFGVDGAQWKRNNVVDQQAIQKVFWSVDPADSSGLASDENTGWGVSAAAADAHPLRSMHALNARLNGYTEDLPLTIHLMSAFPDVTTWEVLSSLSTFTGLTNFVTFTGDYLPIDGASAGNLVTAVQPAVPATNTERSITIAGLGSKPGYLNMMVRTADGGKTAFVTRQLAPDVFAISQPRSSDAAGDSGVVVDFAIADIVDFVDLTRLSDWPFPLTGCPFPLLVKMRLDVDGTASQTADGYIGGQPYIGQCIFGNPTKIGIPSYVLSADGARPTTYSCQMSGQHANSIKGGNWLHYSLAIAIGGDGPQCASCQMQFANELNIVGSGGAPGFRQLPGGPFDVFFPGDQPCQIACFGAFTSAFDLWQPQHAESGSFVVRPDGGGPTNFKWYGIQTAAYPGALALLTLGVGSKSQLPYSALLTVVSTKRPILIDGASFDFADVPINTLSGSTLAG